VPLGGFALPCIKHAETADAAGIARLAAAHRIR
jgi:hypothetical protein